MITAIHGVERTGIDWQDVVVVQGAGPVGISALAVAKSAGATFTKTVNAVSAKLTQNAIVAMKKAVIVDKQSPAAVAGAFLKANGLA